MAYTCEECGAEFKKLSQLLQHRRIQNHWTKFICPSCKKSFTRRDNLDRHTKKHSDENAHHCPECLKVFTRRDALDDHFQRHHDQTGGGQKRKSNASENDGPIKKLKKGADPHQFYTLTKIKSQWIEKFKTTATFYKISFQNIEVTENISSTLRRMFASIFQDVTDRAKSEDLLRVTVQTPTLDYPIVIPFIKLPELTADRFMSEIERVLQSNEDFAIDSGLVLEITHVDMPKGGTRKRCKFVDLDKFLSDKKCILRVQNRDNLCCARAIITAKARKDGHEKWNSIRQGREIQRRLAEKLHKEAGVPPTQCGIQEIKIFQSLMTEYQIYVVSKEHFNAIIFKGPEAEKKIYLYYHDHHYDVITSMPAFVSRNYYCTQCDKGYDHKEDHKCNSVCYACRKVHDQMEDNWIECETCRRFFRGQECYDLHKRLTAKGNSTCSAIYRCTECGKTVNKKMDKKHVDKSIVICAKASSRKHMIPESTGFQEEPMSIEEELISDNAKTYIFFDFECTQDDFVECDMKYSPDVFGKCQNCLKSDCGVYEHKPNLCVVQKVCTLCMDKEFNCENCGQREYIFGGDNTLNDFCHWLFSEEN